MDNSSEKPNNDKIFKYKIQNINGNSATSCLSQCSEFGYPTGGMEYGEECCM